MSIMYCLVKASPPRLLDVQLQALQKVHRSPDIEGTEQHLCDLNSI